MPSCKMYFTLVWSKSFGHINFPLELPAVMNVTLWPASTSASATFEHGTMCPRFGAQTTAMCKFFDLKILSSSVNYYKGVTDI